MPTIQNKALANTNLILGKTLARGDAEGRFEVPEEIAAMLVETPGWARSETGPQFADGGDPVAALRARRDAPAPAPVPAPPSPLPPTQPPPAPTPAPAPTEAASGTPEASDGPDLSKLDREGLLKTAAEYGVRLTRNQKQGDLDELRAYIDKQLYEETP